MAEREQKQKPVLDEDVLDLLAEAQLPAELPASLEKRIKSSLLQKIRAEKAGADEGFSTINVEDEDGWIEALPGAKVKILLGDITVPKSLMSYLVRLEPGFSMHGHDHPFDEECLMLEGDLQLGGLKLSAGDFHFAAAGVVHGDVKTVSGCLAYIRGALPV